MACRPDLAPAPQAAGCAWLRPRKATQLTSRSAVEQRQMSPIHRPDPTARCGPAYIAMRVLEPWGAYANRHDCCGALLGLTVGDVARGYTGMSPSSGLRSFCCCVTCVIPIIMSAPVIYLRGVGGTRCWRDGSTRSPRLFGLLLTWLMILLVRWPPTHTGQPQLRSDPKCS